MSGSGNEKSKKKLFIMLVTITLILIGATLWFLWRRGAFLPHWIVWKDREFCVQEENLEVLLRNRKVYITKKIENERISIWTSPKGMLVQDALACDIDRDGREELLLLCWKVGRYGNHRPFWVERDEHKWSQHIFVYGYDNDHIRQKWASSYIGQDVAQMEVRRGRGAHIYLLLTDPEEKVSSWLWDSWGFKKEVV